MKISTLILILMIVFMLAALLTDGKKDRELQIRSLTIQFDKTDAIFTINFDFDKLSRIFLFMLGSGSIEPKVRSIFSNFDFEIVKMDPDKAILKVKNVSRLEEGYYLHDSRKFGETIDIVYISDFYNTRTYFNINATPNYFYRQ